MTKKKLTSIIVWCVVGVLLLLILIPLCSMLVQKYIKKVDVPMFMGYAWLIVQTPSMGTTYREGDLVIIKKTDDYVLTDVVTFMKEGDTLPTTHRIVNPGPEEGTFITMGDANPTPDPGYITKDQIFGKVVGSIPYVGLFFRWLIDELGIIYLVALVAVIVAGVYFWNITKPEAKKAEAGTDNTKADDASGADSSTDQPEANVDSAQDSVANDNQQQK